MKWLAGLLLEEHTIEDCNTMRHRRHSAPLCASHTSPALQEFLLFFSKVSSTITNKEFEEMIKEMSG
jgi:hypothetical protein